MAGYNAAVGGGAGLLSGLVLGRLMAQRFGQNQGTGGQGAPQQPSSPTPFGNAPPMGGTPPAPQAGAAGAMPPAGAAPQGAGTAPPLVQSPSAAASLSGANPSQYLAQLYANQPALGPAFGS